MSPQIPAPPNFGQAAQQQAQAGQANVNAQTQANRPNQSSPFASTNWMQGPNGQWQQNTQFNGPLGGLSDALQQQAAGAMDSPFSLNGLPALTDGSAARQQAIDAAYGDATKRLDPQFQQREQDLRSRLSGQGLVEGSEAYNNALKSFGQERTDAYQGAMNSAIGQGTAAGNALFGQSLASRQNALAEALRQRGQAFGELQGLQGLTQQQGFMGAGMAQAPDLLGASQAQYGADMQNWQANNQYWADLIGGGMNLAGQLAPFFISDARAKQDIHPTGDTLHGVPTHTWNYLPEYGDPSVRYTGVLAQELQQVAPEYVREREDGMLEVHPAFAPRAL
jgi:hypothetical protein